MIYWKQLLINAGIGLLFLVAGLAAMYWGAYSSCTDGGGHLRGLPLYTQCVSPGDECRVPYNDLITIGGCTAICAENKFSVVGSAPLFVGAKLNVTSGG